MNTETMDVYGKYHLKRTIVALAGLDANPADDAVYPPNVSDSEGKPMNGTNDYVMHFAKDELPAVGAFWSMTIIITPGRYSKKSARDRSSS